METKNRPAALVAEARQASIAEAKGLLKKGSAVYELIQTQHMDEESPIKEIPQYLDAYQYYAWVFAAIRAISQAAAGVPLLAFEIDETGDYQELEGHPALSVINKPNMYCTRHDLIEQTLTYMESTGNSFWELVKDSFGNIREIYVLNPKYMKIKPDPKKFISGYTYEINGKKINYAPDEILHLRYPDVNNDYWGMSPLTPGRESMYQEKHSIAWNKSFFKNSARPDVVFSVTGPLNPKSFARLKSMISKMFGGSGKAHSAAILEGGVEVKPIGWAPKDMDFLAQRKYNRDELLAVLGVPPCIVGVFDSAIRANAEEQRKFFWETTMVQKLEKLEMALNHLFMPQFSKYMPNRKIVLMFDLSSIEALGENTDSKATRLTGLIASGILSRNEARLELGYEALPELDTIYVPFGLQPIGSASVNADAQDPTAQDAPAQEGQKYIKVEPQTPLSKDHREAILKRVTGTRTRLESSAEKELKEYFKVMTDRVVESLNHTLKGRPRRQVLKSFNVDSVYSTTEETKHLNELLHKILQGSVSTAGSIATIELALNLSINDDQFNGNDPRVLDFVRVNALKNATSVAGTTKARLQTVLTEAFDQGKTLNEITTAVRAAMSDMATWRADLISRNEVGIAFNAGRKMAVDQVISENPGVKLFKVWISARDERVRDTHVTNDEITQRRPLAMDERYPNGLLYPQESSGPAEETINCRCVESYVSASTVARSLGFNTRRRVRLTSGVKLVSRMLPFMNTRSRHKAQKLLNQKQDSSRKGETEKKEANE